MRRADRLFQITQLLRSDRVITARSLAEQLEVSERTIYRDMQDISLSGIPILGEAGTGYRLLPGFELPPLMFNEQELGALLLGARMVQAWADPLLSAAAEQALDKIDAVLPPRLRPELSRTEMLAPGFALPPEVAERLALLRVATREKNRLQLAYTRADGEASERTIRPLGLAYWGRVWTLVAWCELRNDFRHFRVDRIQTLFDTGHDFHDEPGKCLQDFLAIMQCEDNGV